MFKRWRPRARGRAARIRKRTCHITLKLAPVAEATVTRAEPATEEKPKRAPRRRKPATPKAEAEAPKSEEKPKPRRRAATKPKTTTRKKTEPKEESES
jgi:hypothetical protein